MLHLPQVYYAPPDYESVPAGEWRGRTVVVIDVLRATSTLVTALAEGVKEVRCFREISEARAYANGKPAVALAGEREGVAPEGFNFGNSPREFLGAGNRYETVVLTTTNGTRALEAVKPAACVVLCSFLNFSVVVDFLRKNAHGLERNFAIVCSGTGELFALEDGLLAGALLSELGLPHPAAKLYESCVGRLREAFYASKNGKNLRKLGLEADIDWCLQRDKYRILPTLQEDGGISN
ncbi:MAG: 2-phosphosulfolactate phosphatase [Methylacidiphilales bacterium]|nr:2-phosphosulfolactate phosphatase [Candidatus Methylacidiphilales bacterium]